jgi:hypothetical protein
MSRQCPLDDLSPGMFIVCDRVPEGEASPRHSRRRAGSVIRIGGKRRILDGWPMEVLVVNLPFVTVRRVRGQGVGERRFPIDVRRYRLHRVDAEFAASLAVPKVVPTPTPVGEAEPPREQASAPADRRSATASDRRGRE